MTDGAQDRHQCTVLHLNVKQTVDVHVVDEIGNLLFGYLKPQTVHHCHQFFRRDTSVAVFIEQRERLSQL